MTGVTPRSRVESACQTLGRKEVVGRCVAMLAGGDEGSDFIVMMGGDPALSLVGSPANEGQHYWLRVWAARGLLWAGPGGDPEPLRLALRDECWRVREMTCKVIARHRVGDLLGELAALAGDPVPRVSAAAARAARRILAAGA